VKPSTFLIAVAIGRFFRYGGEAWLAYEYGEEATAFIRQNLPLISVWVAAIVGVLGIGLIFWRRRRAA
jgi:membrane protein DedA with SNARE-associated domain